MTLSNSCFDLSIGHRTSTFCCPARIDHARTAIPFREKSAKVHKRNPRPNSRATNPLSVIWFTVATGYARLAGVRANGPGKNPADTSKGKPLVDSKGMTLYTFDKDAGGKSMCNGPCADNWPPVDGQR
jgi:Secreted repeat of unknown function